jgi:hypothetical protein
MIRRAVLLLLAATAASCSSSSSQPGPSAEPTASGAAASASGSGATGTASASGSAAAGTIGAAPACTVAAEKSWTTGANKVTGLTAAELPDGRVAIGLAVGNTPHVLVVGRNGEGKLVKVPPKAGTPLAKGGKDVRRTVLRVTPVKVDGDDVQAFVDFRDELADKRKRVSCGPADGSHAWISFEGVPYLDLDPKPSDTERKELFRGRDDDGDGGYHELRDCRSFADIATGETWIIGSELRATEKDGNVTWKASLVIDRGPKTHENHLHELDLRGDPPKVTDYQVPMLRRLHDGSWVLTARYGDSLLAVLLDANKSIKGPISTYPGHPSRADVASDGDDTIVATSIAKGKDFVLRALRLDGKQPVLPKTLSPIVTDDDAKDSETEPDFTRDAKGRRWISYIEGERGNGHLEIVPVDANFHATGKPFEITKEEERASEARLVELAGGSILVAFLREKDKEVELVTEELTCEPTAK